MLIRDTDRGKELMVQTENLRELIMAYRQGLIKESEWGGKKILNYVDYFHKSY